MSTHTKLGIIVLNYYGLADTADCLTSLQPICQENPAVKVYVVNATDRPSQKDATQGEVLGRQFPFVSVIETPNLGFSGAHNHGTKVALSQGAAEIMWLNNDTTVPPNFLQPLQATIKDKSIGAVTPKIYFSPGREYHHVDYAKEDIGKVIWYAGGIIDWDNIYAFHRGVDEVDRGQFDQKQETDFCTGCCFITRSDVFERVGFFADKLFLYYEDTDWSIRLHQAGLKTLYEPNSVIWHKNAGSTKGSGSDLQVYYQTRNRIYFGLKYAPYKTKAALIRESLHKWQSGSTMEKKAVRHAFTNRFGNRHAK